MYAACVDSLDPEDRNARQQLDAQLGVDGWYVPGVGAKPRGDDVPDNAPAWWHGDEDASQSFMREMGVR